MHLLFNIVNHSNFLGNKLATIILHSILRVLFVISKPKKKNFQKIML